MRLLGKLSGREAARSGLSDRRDMLFSDEYGINEAVNFRQRAIFIAVPKTGTTSVRRQLREKQKYLVEVPHLDLREVRTALDFFFTVRGLGANRSFPTDLSKVPEHEESLGRAAEFYRTSFKFGSVRNPFARVVSLFKRREGLTLSDELDFSQFCDRLAFASDTSVWSTRHRTQSDWLKDRDGEIGVDFVLKLEEREAGLKTISEMTDGRIVLDNRKLNVNEATQPSSYRDAYDDKSRRKIATLFEEDLDRFRYKF
jgi:hypothetical protein